MIAAGHAAGYVMQLAGQQPPIWSRVVLAAPTWCGPLVAAMGEHQGWYGLLKSCFDWARSHLQPPRAAATLCLPNLKTH